MELEPVVLLPLYQALQIATYRTVVNFREGLLYKARISRDLQENNRRLTYPPPCQLLVSDYFA